MKRMLCIALCALAVTAAAFAQNFTVQEIAGRVELETGENRWETIRAGDTLKTDAVVRTGIGASLTVKTGDQVLTIGPAKTGKIGELAAGGTVIQIQGKVSQTDTSAKSRLAGSTITASARGKSAAAEIEVAEE